MDKKIYVFVCLLALAVPDTGADSAQAIARANSNFGLNLYKKIANASGNENVFFSPFSISAALAMFYTGARGQCSTQMGEVLGYTNDVQSHRGYKELFDKVFKESTSTYVLTLANRLFGSDALEFKEQYLSDLENYYGAELEDMDFTDPEDAREEINDWVADETNDKIKDLFPEGTIKRNTILVLANAIYFKGIWKHMFKKDQTRTGPFTLSDPPGGTQDVQFMQLTEAYKSGISQDLNANILEMPYDGENVAFYVLMPRKGSSLSQVEEALSHEKLETAIKDLPTISGLNIKIPKFNMTWKMSLNGLLYDMGLKCPFGPGADFSGILESGSLFASEVVHQAFVMVNEEGTEAAAATGIASTRTMPPRFWVNKPFIFLIRDNSTGSILFMGRVTNPGSAAEEVVPTMRFARFRRSEISADTEQNPPVDTNAYSKTMASPLSLIIVTIYVFIQWAEK